MVADVGNWPVVPRRCLSPRTSSSPSGNAVATVQENLSIIGLVERTTADAHRRHRQPRSLLFVFAPKRESIPWPDRCGTACGCPLGLCDTPFLPVGCSPRRFPHTEPFMAVQSLWTPNDFSRGHMHDLRNALELLFFLLIMRLPQTSLFSRFRLISSPMPFGSRLTSS